MKVKEVMSMRGRFNLRVYKRGELVEVYTDRNQIVDGARSQVAHLLGGDNAGRSVAKIAVGTNGRLPAPTDTSITAAFAKPISAVEFPSRGQVKFIWTIGAMEANGKAIREFGLLSEDGTLIARRTRDEALAKDDDIVIDGEWTIVF